MADTLPSTWLIAHRGGPADYPESSLAAYRADAAAGFPLEMDLRSLADGTLVVMHDPTVDRTTNGHGRVSGFTPTSWSALRIDGGGGPPPTWKEVLSEFGGAHLLVVETKDRAATPRFVASVTDRHLKGSVIGQSFNLQDATTFAAAGIESMLLTDTPDTATLNARGIAWVGLSAAVPHRKDVIARMHAHGIKAAVWTVDDPRLARTVRREGADALFTNDPWALRPIAAERH